MPRPLAERLFHPVTRERWKRFRAMKRAWWSFLILSGLTVLSLFAELLCNDAPLVMRWEGRWCFPVFSRQSEDRFLHNGNHGRPDYAALRRSAAFRADPGNVMLFPPVPCGARRTVGPDDVDLPPEVTVTIRPLPRQASLDVRADGTVARAVSGELFFGRADRDLEGLALAAAWGGPLPGVLSAGLADRFANRAAPALDLPVRLGGRPVRLRLAAFEPGPEPRRKFRLGLEEDVAAGQAWRAVFGPDGAFRSGSRHDWEALPEPARALVRERAVRRFAGAVPAEEALLDGRNVLLKVDKASFTLPLGPVPGHPLGLDAAGHDVLAWIVYAFRTSMCFGILLVLFSQAAGVAIGALQGYYGGILDLSVQRLTEVWSSLPFLYVMILLGAVYGRGFVLLLAVYVAFHWIGISYYMRAEFLRLRRQPFVEAARVAGLTPARIIFRHMLPNALAPLITFVPFSLVGAIGVLSALDYLGFGLPPLTPSWGALLADAQANNHAWWLTLYPSLALFLTMLLCVFVGEGVRSAFDPRRQARME